MPFPKIVYTPAGGGATTLNFAAFPREVAAYNRVATRHDNLSTAGVKETITERVDNFLELSMPYSFIGTDVNAWDTFMQQALQGLEFDYYPDASQASHTTYTLEDTTWRPNWKSLGVFQFALKFRAVIS